MAQQIKSKFLEDASVITSKLADLAVDTGKLADAAVLPKKLGQIAGIGINLNSSTKQLEVRADGASVEVSVPTGSIDFGVVTDLSASLTSANDKILTQFTADADRDVTSGVITLDAHGAPTGRVIVAIYADNAGAPGELLSESTNTNNYIDASGLIVDVGDIPSFFGFDLPVHLTNGSTYWYGIQFDTANSTPSVDANNYVHVALTSNAGFTSKLFSTSTTTFTDYAVTGNLLWTTFDQSYVRVADNGISSAKIAANAVTTAKILDANITTAKIADANVTSSKLASSIALAGTPTAATAAFGTSTTQIATTAFVQSALSAAEAGLKPKEAVFVASSTNVDIATALIDNASIGGEFVVAGNRVLLYGQTNPAQNGIYIVASSGAASRATDFDSLTPVDEVNRAWVAVQAGTDAGKTFVEYGDVSLVDSDPIFFSSYDPLANLIGGDMINVSGSTISLDLATVSGLESTNPGNSAGQLRIKLEATNPTLQINGSNELGVKFDSVGGLQTGLNGLSVKLSSAGAIGVVTSGPAQGLRVIVDGTTIDIDGSNEIYVVDGAITGLKLADSAVDLAGTKITGVLGFANGGTGLSSVGADGNILTASGGVWVSAAPAPVYVWGKEKITLSGTDITNGYVDLAQDVQANSIIAFVERLGMQATDDYTVSVVGGVTRITFANSLASGGSEALVAGDLLYFTYQY